MRTCLCHNTIRVHVCACTEIMHSYSVKDKRIKNIQHEGEGGGLKRPCSSLEVQVLSAEAPPTVSGNEWVGVWVVQPEVNREKLTLLFISVVTRRRRRCSLNTPVYFSAAQTGELGLISEATACLSQRFPLKHGFDLNVAAASCSSVHRLLYWFPFSHRAEC